MALGTKIVMIARGRDLFNLWTERYRSFAFNLRRRLWKLSSPANFKLNQSFTGETGRNYKEKQNKVRCPSSALASDNDARYS